MTELIHCLVVSPRRPDDPRSRGLLHDAHALGLEAVTHISASDLYFIEGALTAHDQDRLVSLLLSDPVAEKAEWRRFDHPAHASRSAQHIIEVAYRPGVTDPVAEQIVRGAHQLGVKAVARAATGLRFDVRSKTGDPSLLHQLARGLLANAVIQHYTLGEIVPHFPAVAQSTDATDTILVRGLDDAALLGLSQDRRAALDLAEMRAIQTYFAAEGRDPTDVEFEMIAQTWSEHCVHKTFKALIQVTDDGGRQTAEETPLGSESLLSAVGGLPSEIDGLLKTYLRSATEAIKAPWVRSAFVDNAGIIDFDDAHEVSFKVETHNHPSAIEPFGGANTGLGGVIRDVLGVSARPIASTDILCFGPQDVDPATLPGGVLHPRRVRSGVVAGIKDYGNKIGLPTVNGAIWYDPGYTSNPLVFCGCVGIAPKDKHPRTPQAGDRVIVLGGRTGRDGLRGATFSSMTMDAQTGEVAGASVQIGDPIVEKGLIEVIVRARDLGLYHAITDCGAGGLSSAVGEMASGCGADVDLATVRLKYAGLAPWEIWLSEAQERMVLAVPVATLQALQDICATFDVELTDIGAFNESGRLRVAYGARRVLDLANDFLHDGIPQRHLKATVTASESREAAATPVVAPAGVSYGQVLLRLLRDANIATKADVIRVYDHEILGGTVVKPLTGLQHDGPADAAVIKPTGTAGTRGIVLSNGLNPDFGKRDAYRMAWSVIDEAIRNAVAVGADPSRIAILDNFCWGDPTRPETLGSLLEAARGCHDAAIYYGTPFISGKDSLNNEYLGTDGKRHAIPPTLLISAIGLIDDVRTAVTSDLKCAGHHLFLVGATRAEMAGAHVWKAVGAASAEREASCDVPGPVDRAPELYQALHDAISQGIVAACHDLSEGGLAVAAAEMCIGGRLGLALTLPEGEPFVQLFSESNGRLLVEVAPAHVDAFVARFAGLPAARLGLVTDSGRLTISTRVDMIVDVPVAELVKAWLNPA